MLLSSKPSDITAVPYEGWSQELIWQAAYLVNILLSVRAGANLASGLPHPNLAFHMKAVANMVRGLPRPHLALALVTSS